MFKVPWSNMFLVGGFNPFEKYWSKWESSPNRDEHKKYLKPTTQVCSSLRHIWDTCIVVFKGPLARRC